MEKMFYGCKQLKSIDVSRFNTEKVTRMSYMFSECTNLKEVILSNINNDQKKNSLDKKFIKVDMSFMFFNCSSLNKLNLSYINNKHLFSMSYSYLNF